MSTSIFPETCCPVKNPDWFSYPGVSKHPSLIPRLMSRAVSLFFLRYPWMFPMVNLSRESPVTHTSAIPPGKRVIYHGKCPV